MNKKILFTIILFLCLCGMSFSQSSEGRIFEIASRIKCYLPQNDQANLTGENRYIQMGLVGLQNEVDEFVGYMDRFAVNDNDMIGMVETSTNDGSIQFYKFYLNPLYDANNFQKMMEMLKVTNFFMGSNEHPIGDLSNTIYASIKSKNK